jgi:hypothetical protein
MNTYLTLLISRIPFYLAKAPFRKNYYFHLFMPLVGGIYYLIERKINKFYLPFYFLVIYGAFLSLIYKDLSSGIRCLQLFLLLGFSNYLLAFFKQEDFERLARIVIVTSAFYIIFEAYFVGFIAFKDMGLNLNIILPRYLGIIGESNFTSVMLVGLSFFALVKKQKAYALLGIVSLFPLCSRVAIVMVLMGFFFILLQKYMRNHFNKFLTIIFLCLFLSPLIFSGLELILTDDLKLLLNKILSGRYVINLSYIEMLKDYPLGVGYFRSPTLFKYYSEVGSTLLTDGLIHYGFFKYQPHNLLLQVLSEFGFIGYALFFWFNWRLLNLITLAKSNLGIPFIIILIGFTTLNGLSEFILYFTYAWIIKSCTDEVSFTFSNIEDKIHQKLKFIL